MFLQSQKDQKLLIFFLSKKKNEEFLVRRDLYKLSVLTFDTLFVLLIIMRVESK